MTDWERGFKMDSINGLTYIQKYLNLGVAKTEEFNNTNNFIRKHLDPEVWDTLQQVTDYTLPSAYPTLKGDKLEGYIIIDLDKFHQFKILLRALILSEVLDQVRESYQFYIDKIEFKT